MGYNPWGRKESDTTERLLCVCVRTDAEAEAPILWPPDKKSQFIGKDPDAGKD